MSVQIGQKVCIPDGSFDYAIVRRVLGGEFKGWVDCEIHDFDGGVGLGLLPIDRLQDYAKVMDQIDSLMSFGMQLSARP